MVAVAGVDEAGVEEEPEVDEEAGAEELGGASAYNEPVNFKAKLELTCRDWNITTCTAPGCTLYHKCSADIGGGRICWDPSHTRRNHGEATRS